MGNRKITGFVLQFRILKFEIFLQHRLWIIFGKNVQADGKTLKSFCDALEQGDDETVEEILQQYLKKRLVSVIHLYKSR